MIAANAHGLMAPFDMRTGRQNGAFKVRGGSKTEAVALHVPLPPSYP